MHMRMLLVAAPSHPLHLLGRPVTQRDLRKHRHIVVRDSGTQRDKTPLNLEAKQTLDCQSHGHVAASCARRSRLRLDCRGPHS